MSAAAAAVFAVAIGYGAILPLLPVVLAHLMPDATAEATAAHTGVLTATYLLAVLVLAPVWGAVSDRLGRRAVLAFGLAGYAGALAGFAWAHSMAQAYTLRFAAGAFAAAVLPSAAALVAETTALRRRAARLAWLTAASLVGYLAGPAITGGIYALRREAQTPPLTDTLAALIGWPLYSAAAIAAVALVAVRFALPRLPPSAVREAVAGSPGSTGRLAAIAALAFLAMFGLGAFEVGVTVFADRRLAFTPAALALVFAACSVAMLIVQGLLAVGPRLHPRSAGLLVAGGFAAMGVGFALLALGGAPARLFAAVMLVGAGSGVLLPLLANLAVDRARAGIGATLGVQIAAASFGQGAGSAAGGWLFGAVAEASFWLYALLMAAAAAGVVATRFGSAGDATAGAVRSETEAHP